MRGWRSMSNVRVVQLLRKLSIITSCIYSTNICRCRLMMTQLISFVQDNFHVNQMICDYQVFN